MIEFLLFIFFIVGIVLTVKVASLSRSVRMLAADLMRVHEQLGRLIPSQPPTAPIPGKEEAPAPAVPAAADIRFEPEETTMSGDTGPFCSDG